MTTPQAVTLLLDAQFVLINAATAADAPPVVLAFRLIRHPEWDRARACTTCSATARPPPASTPWLGLYFMDADKFKLAASQVAADGGEVTIAEGDRRTRVPIGDVIPRIVSGEYPQRLARMYSAPKRGEFAGDATRPPFNFNAGAECPSAGRRVR